MRDQYVGDVSDAIKFGLLRALVRDDRYLGIAWYYDPGDDGGPDGRHIDWQESPDWAILDPEVQAGLLGLPQRNIDALEVAPFWPTNVSFHREPVPSGMARASWGMNKRQALEAADVVFLDPDNGIGRETPKHATMAELRDLRRPGRSLVFITFPGRRPHAEILSELHAEVREGTGAKSVVTLRTNVSVPAKRPGMFVQRARWFTIVDGDEELVERASAFAVAMASIPRVKAVLN